MTIRKWEKVYLDWRGTAAELAEVAQGVIEAIGMKDLEVHPNERLIRHYAQLGILDRADRKGREAFFGFKQLAQYLVARNLALDGWPLAKIAEFTSTSELSGLLDLIPKPVRQKKVSLSKASEQIREDAKKHTVERQELNTFFQRLQNISGESREKLLREIVLTPWCRVLIDQNVLHKLNPEDAELIGKKLARVLKVNSVISDNRGEK